MFRQFGTEEWLPANIPGCVHTDLLDYGNIQDPYYRRNELDVQWIDKKHWEYRTHFDVDDDLLSQAHIELVFCGLDTYTDIYINDRICQSTDNMFRTWRIDIRDYLRQGENELLVFFRSPIKEDLPKLRDLGYALPAGNDQSELGGLGEEKVSVFARKAGYHYGWDWGPRLVTSGIWRPVELHTWNQAALRDLHIRQDQIRAEKAHLTAQFVVESSVVTAAQLRLVISEPNATAIEVPVELTPGQQILDVSVELDNPRLWWSHGLGEAFRYQIRGQLLVESRIQSETALHVGLRSIELIREDDQVGQSFYFKLNDVPVFAKGANWIPSDNFLPRISADQYRSLLESAVNANMNMLRVWGGGIYEDDLFYDLCSELGIMVWQDFMFACSLYPGDNKFIETVTAEATDNLIRLRNQACVVLWCGNNEIDVAWSHYDENSGWGWKELFSAEQRDLLWSHYERLFHNLLPNLVNMHSPQIPYWPSSPMAGPRQHASYSSRSGDIHYWGVWHQDHPFSDYNRYIGRFMSEYGFQSFPEMNTIETFTIPSERQLESATMTHHQRSKSGGNERIQAYLERHYRIPTQFAHFVYLSQLVQAEGVRVAMEAHRRAMPFCMGSLFWQLNDCWPVASWSSVDYYGRWKALQYFARRAYTPILLSPWLENDILKLYAVNDGIESLPLIVKAELIAFSGECLQSWQLEKELTSLNSQLLHEWSATEILNDADPATVCLSCKALADDQLVSENKLYFVTVKELKLQDPKLTWQIITGADSSEIVIQCESLAKNIFIQLQNGHGRLEDNFFDLLPGETHRIRLIGQHSDSFEDPHLIISSVWDTYQG